LTLGILSLFAIPDVFSLSLDGRALHLLSLSLDGRALHLLSLSLDGRGLR